MPSAQPRLAVAECIDRRDLAFGGFQCGLGLAIAQRAARYRSRARFIAVAEAPVCVAAMPAAVAVCAVEAARIPPPAVCRRAVFRCAADLRMDGALIDALIIITSLRPECPAYTNLRYRNLV